MLLRTFSVSVSVSNGAGFVGEAVCGREKAAVAQILVVEPIEARRRCRHPECRAPVARGKGTLHEEAAETLGGALDGAELRIQAIQKAAGRRGDRHGGQVHEQRAGNRVACRPGRGAIAGLIAGRNRLVRDQEADDV